MAVITLDGLEADGGTVVVFSGDTVPHNPGEEQRRPWVAVDHPMAQPIADAIGRGELVMVVPERWQII